MEEYFSAIDQISIGVPMLPAQSSRRSDTLALQLLALSSGYDAASYARLFESAGLSVLEQKNFYKDPKDPSHTCAYTIGKGIVFTGIIPREALVVSIRGTSGGEWYSNFDFCPSHQEDSRFAENFLFAAEEVFLSLEPYLRKVNQPWIIVCGHSRGAACANLLGVLLNEYQDPVRNFVYTFATPRTIRYDLPEDSCNNIFNYLNPCDLVPQLPLEQWGFRRAGTDILLAGDNPLMEHKVEEYKDLLAQTAPSISSYYEDQHALDAAGLSEDGFTAFDLMLLVCQQLVSVTDDLALDSDFGNDGTDSIQDLISQDSDFAPLLTILEEVTADDFSLGKVILLEHLPFSYLAGIEALRE